MNTRISSAMFSQSVSLMLANQAALAKTQNQLATGLKLNTAKDDPIAAGLVVALDRTEAELLRFGANATVLGNRLSLQESTLAGANDILSRLKEIAVQANGGALSLGDRQAFAVEIRQLRDGLLAIGNASDGQGRFLFGGARDGSPPFVANAVGVEYVGDTTQRRIEVAPEIAIADTDPGSEVFMRVRAGNGTVAARAEVGNTGTASLRAAGFVDQRLWDGDGYRVEFAAGGYTVLDSGGGTVAAGAYQSGQGIQFRGYQLTVVGTPDDGDAFVVGPAVNRDVFAIVDSLLEAVNTPDSPAAEQAVKQNRFFAALEDIDRASEHLIDARAGLGARLSALDRGGEEREGALLIARSTLSELRDLDYAEAVSRLSRQVAALEAAQLAFARTQSLSLFNLIGR